MELDHVVILVSSLKDAIPRFARVGFSVERGGVHPAWGTENALIPLADGMYIELLAARDLELAARHRLWRAPGGGIRRAGEYGGFALRSRDLEEDVARIRRAGLALDGPQEGSRRRPDGRLIRWRGAYFARPDLPFLIEDETARGLRIAPPEHGLGVHAHIVEITVAVDELDEASRAYALLLEAPPTGSTELQADLEVRFQQRWGTIVIVRRRPEHRRDRDPVRSVGVESLVLGLHPWRGTLVNLSPHLQRASRIPSIDPAWTGGATVFIRPFGK